MAKKGLKKNKRSSQKEEETSDMSNVCEVDIAKESRKLGSVLRQIVDQIDDAERSNTDTLQEMQERLNTLSEQTSDAKSSENNINKEELEKLETQIAGLSDRIEIISQGRAINADNLEGRIEALAARVTNDEVEAEDSSKSHQTAQKAERPVSEAKAAGKSDTDEIKSAPSQPSKALKNEEQNPSTAQNPSTEADADEHEGIQEADITFAVTDQLEEDGDFEPSELDIAENIVQTAEDYDIAAAPPTPEDIAPSGKVDYEVDHQIRATNYPANKPIAPQHLANLAEHFSPVISKTSDEAELDDQDTESEPVESKPVVATSPKQAVQENQDLEDRFAMIASRLEETLASNNDRNQQERKEISSKFDELAARFENWLSSSTDQKNSFNNIEQRIDSLTEYVQKAEAHAARIEVLEGQLMKLIDLVENNKSDSMLHADLGNAFEDIASRILEEKSVQIADMIASKVEKNFESGISDERLKEIQQSISAISAERQFNTNLDTPGFSAVNETLMSMSGRLNDIEEQIRLERAYTQQDLKKNTSLENEKVEENIPEESDSFHSELELSVHEVIEEGNVENIPLQPSHPNDLSHQNEFLPPPLVAPEPLFEANSDKPHFIPQDNREDEVNEDYIAAAKRAAQAAYDQPHPDTAYSSFQQEDGVFDKIKGQKERFVERGTKLKKRLLSMQSPSATSLFVVGAIGLMLLCIGILFKELSSPREKSPEFITRDGSAKKTRELNRVARAPLSAPEDRMSVDHRAEYFREGSLRKSQITKQEQVLDSPKREKLFGKKYTVGEDKQPGIHEIKSTRRLGNDQAGKKKSASEISIGVDDGSGKTKNMQLYRVAQAPGQNRDTANPVVTDNRKIVQEPLLKKSRPQYIKQLTPEAVNSDYHIALPPEQIGSIALRTAAASGNYKAQYSVAMRYAKGEKIKQNYAAAARWLKRAAAQSFAPAQYYLGNLYEKGQGVPRDLAKARAWYLRAANRGNVNAMHDLAVMYTDKSSKPQNYREAILWFKMAADYGHPGSQYNLGVLYKDGVGVKTDKAEAYKWFSLSMAAGIKHSASQLIDLKPHLSKEQLATVESDIAGWRKRQSNKAANLTEKEVLVYTGSHMPPFASTLVYDAQKMLNKLGYDVGPVDGQFGPKTRDAIKSFQLLNGLEATGVVTPKLISILATQTS